MRPKVRNGVAWRREGHTVSLVTGKVGFKPAGWKSMGVVAW